MFGISDKELVHSSFYITYAFLMTTATITFIEAIRTKDAKIRNILNLETCISVVAAFFYGKFVAMAEEKGSNTAVTIDYKKINFTRYLDWSITTPIMLLVLVLALLYNNKSGSFNFFSFLFILVLNYGMLGAGYLGEIQALDKNISNGIGFLFFIAMYYFIYSKYVAPKKLFDNMILFFVFVILWAFYGIVYFLDEVKKNVVFNVLDLLSKCFVGIFFWAYYTKVFTLSS
jgi:bacteriorhodopsin